MALVEFKKKKNPKNKILVGIIIFIVLLIMINGVRYIYGLGFRTATANPSVLSDRIDGTGLVIKSERVYKSNSSGNVEYIEDEGNRIPVGKNIVKVISSNEDILAQLDSIEKEIDELGIKHYTEENNSNLLEDIQKKVNEGNYKDINEFLEEKNSIDENTNLVATNLEALLKKQSELNELLNNAYKINTSQHSGVLSYEIDGYEEILKPQNFENYNYESIDFNSIEDSIRDNETTEALTGGSPLFKIIDDYIWYIAFKIEDERILEFEEGQAYDIEFSEDITLRGRIIRVNSNDSEGVLVIEFKDGLHEFYKNRILDIALIKSKVNAFEVPTRSIIQKDGQDGVYINHVYGIVKFVPVNILYEDEDITYIEQGNNEARIIIEGEEVRTITEFDEIFLNPSNLEEDQILK